MARSHVFGAVDMGSNTLKVRLWQIDAFGHAVAIDQRRLPVRLGKGTFQEGILSQSLINGAVEALREIRALADHHGASTLRAVATAAMREAQNAGALVARAQRETGIEVEIISTEREGELTAKGALSSLTLARDERAAIVDIGGGSAEVVSVISGGEGRFHSMTALSLPLGAVRLTEAFLPSDPPGPGELKSLAKHVTKTLMASPLTPPDGVAVGCGGTLVSMARIAALFERVDSQAYDEELPPLRQRILRSLLGEMSALSAARRAARFHLEPQRAEVIVAGATVLDALLEVLHTDVIRVVPSGLREGLLVEHLASLAR